MRKIAIAWGVVVIGCALGVALSWGAAADDNAVKSVPDARVEAVLTRFPRAGFTPADGKYLHDLIVQHRYRVALDVGTAQGASAIWFAQAMRKTGGKVITIEIDPAQAAIARRNFHDAGVADIVESRIGDALQEIPRLADQFDFVFLDTATPINKRLLDLVYAHVAPGGAIVAHNALSSIFKQRDFVQAVRGNPELRTELVPSRSGWISVSLKAGPLIS